jgi:hypothetical protein
MKQTIKNKHITGLIDQQIFSNILFESLVIRNSKITETKFQNVHFKSSWLGTDTVYTDCQFEKCKFFGKRSVLGAYYLNCNFIDCEFIGVILFENSQFVKCNFSGKIKNVIIRDRHPTNINEAFTFKQCDLSNIVFDHLSLYAKYGFIDCILPSYGIRKYKNDNDTLIERAIKLCSGIESDDKIEVEIIFDKDLLSGQNPIILDDLFLNSFFKTHESRKIFDEIVKGFEIE